MKNKSLLLFATSILAVSLSGCVKKAAPAVSSEEEPPVDNTVDVFVLSG